MSAPIETRTTVLVTTDGSALAGAAFPYAERLAVSFAAPVTLLGVERASGVQREDSLGDALTAAADALRGRGMTVHVQRRAGDPVEEILAAAGQEETAVLVIATHGRSGLSRLRLGSVADGGLRNADCPVVLVRPSALSPGGQVDLNRLMAPLDGSALAEGSLPLAGVMAAALGATLVLVRVEPFVAAVAPEAGYLPNVAELDRAAAAAAEAYLEQAQSQFEGRVHTEVVVLRGTPAPALERFAREEAIDLVVMTTHGRGGIRRALLGSTADHLVRAGLPVMMLRSRRLRRPSATPTTAGVETRS